jgi:hypothetical protein
MCEPVNQLPVMRTFPDEVKLELRAITNTIRTAKAPPAGVKRF